MHNPNFLVILQSFASSWTFPGPFQDFWRVFTAGTKVKFIPRVVFRPQKVNALQVVLYNRPRTSWTHHYQSCIGGIVELPNVYINTANVVYWWTGGMMMKFNTCVSVLSPS